MKRKLALTFSSLLVASVAQAESLYYIGSEAQESMPLKWVVGMDLIYDDNVTPGYGDDNSGAISPYVGASMVNMTPQTTWDVYAKVGMIYYFDQPSALGADDTYSQTRAGVNLTHRFSERLRLSSRSFVAYELEPDYTQGFATSRQVGEYLYWQTDNALGYRWTERLATYTGFNLTGLEYSDTDNSDRFTWTLYNQFRYQVNPEQTVLTLDYRYAETESNGWASNYTDHYILAGIEHRFSPTMIMIARAGLQIHESDMGGDTTSPYAEVTLRNQVNEQLMVRAYARYGMEVYDTVNYAGSGALTSLYEFDERAVLRLGVSGEYAVSPMFTVIGGVDYIHAVNDEGRRVQGLGAATVSGLEQDLINLYVGVSVKFNDNLYGSLNYNYTDSTSDFANQEYDRNRVSLGVRYEF